MPASISNFMLHNPFLWLICVNRHCNIFYFCADLQFSLHLKNNTQIPQSNNVCKKKNTATGSNCFSKDQLGQKHVVNS